MLCCCRCKPSGSRGSGCVERVTRRTVQVVVPLLQSLATRRASASSLWRACMDTATTAGSLDVRYRVDCTRHSHAAPCSILVSASGVWHARMDKELLRGHVNRSEPTHGHRLGLMTC